MVFKNIALLSTIVALAVFGRGPTTTEACASPLIDSMYDTLKTSMYNMLESMNKLMDNWQKELDVYNQYIKGNADFSAYAKARNDLYKAQNEFYQNVMNYGKAAANMQNSFFNGMTMPSVYPPMPSM